MNDKQRAEFIVMCWNRWHPTILIGLDVAWRRHSGVQLMKTCSPAYVEDNTAVIMLIGHPLPVRIMELEVDMGVC